MRALGTLHPSMYHDQALMGDHMAPSEVQPQQVKPIRQAIHTHLQRLRTTTQI
jgi:hypothetical protein